ncbi:transposase [Streptomyces sp. NPDC058964]|uniref:transposase n=1 Tax=Streptomyces sp. NPDC058964 TaxID=3346681 RepID=UPI00367AF85A
MGTPAAGRRPAAAPDRRVVDAIRCIVDNGAQWRALPADSGIPRRTVFGYLARWGRPAFSKASLTSSGAGCA